MKKVEIFEIYKVSDKDETSDAIMFNFDNSKYLTEICRIANGEVIYLKEGFYLKKRNKGK